MAQDETRKSLLKQSKKKSKKSFRGLVTGKSKRDKKKGEKWTDSDSEPIPATETETETATTETHVTQKEPDDVTQKEPDEVTQKEPDVVAPLAKPQEVIEPPTEVEEKKKTPKAKATDEETVYGAEFDEASKAPTATASIAASETLTKESESVPLADPINIVLLLMDPDTRRFELLQLEFDTTRATVNDILQQIPISATEESLRIQKFKCVCDTTGREYDHDKPLSDYVEGNAVVISVPNSDNKGSVHAARMARPILTDPKVEGMLRSAGVTVPTLKAPEEEVKHVDTIKTTSVTTTSEEKAASTAPSTPTPSFPPVNKPVVSKLSTTESQPSESDTSSSFKRILIIGAVLAYVTRVLVNFQGQTTTPLMPGSRLQPGAWKSRCGLIQSNGCEPAYIEMGIDGNLHIVKSEGVTFSLVGKVCGEEEEDCVPGAVIQEDGTLKIGGSVPKLMQKSKHPLTPWPFQEGVVPSKGKKAWF